MAQDYDPSLIERFAALVPKELEARSGKVFYAGRAAFGAPCPIYLLGFNPGGHEEDHPDETIGEHTWRVLEEWSPEWTALLDEGWRPARRIYRPGEAPGQRRIRHLLKGLGLGPRRVPHSNLILIRSPRSKDLSNADRALAERLWPFHKAVIQRLGVRVVACLGKEPGNLARELLAARLLVGRIQKQHKNRRWTSEAWCNDDGLCLSVATSPSVADWTNPAADPTPLVRGLLERVGASPGITS